MKPDEFYTMTPAEYNIMVRGYDQRRDTYIEDLLFLAWQTARLQRVKKMPSYNKLISKGKSKRVPAEKQKADLQALKQRFGE